MSVTDGLAITGVGLVCSLGRDVVTACAAARAGLTHSIELDTLDFGTEAMFGEPDFEKAIVYGHVVHGLGDGFAGVGRALVHGGAALDDLLKTRPLGDRERTRTGLVVAVSDAFVEDLDARARGLTSMPSTRWRDLTQTFPQRIAESRGLALSPTHHLLHRGGNAGGAGALLDAADRIRNGEIDRCIVGGVDARTEPGFLRAAARLFQLRTKDNPVGLCPGEAATFYMIERESDAQRSGYPPLARIGGAWLARDVVRGANVATSLLDENTAPTGQGLSEVLHAALAACASKTGHPVTPWVTVDHNGTARRATEWANAMTRVRATRPVEMGGPWFPAEQFGDVGAASAGVAISAIVRAFQRGYAKHDAAVVCLSSESGQKGAITLTHASQR